MTIPVILAGGQGTRLSPMLRSARPKQLKYLIGAGSGLFQQTWSRVSDTFRYKIPIVVTNPLISFPRRRPDAGAGRRGRNDPARTVCTQDDIIRIEDEFGRQ
ncbi:sugar phosphate nucleotidyltransferase [Devosia albogilva]|uniref:Sugar phosphate nucleotidyltransferase n=1 Tax=Devosia albogilva TaxID=429726 RepID=A0ABW5QME0_9HYPH